MLQISFFNLFVGYLVRLKDGETAQGEGIGAPVLDYALDEELPEGEDVDVVDDGEREEALLDEVLLAHGLLTLRVLSPSIRCEENADSCKE